MQKILNYLVAETNLINLIDITEHEYIRIQPLLEDFKVAHRVFYDKDGEITSSVAEDEVNDCKLWLFLDIREDEKVYFIFDKIKEARDKNRMFNEYLQLPAVENPHDKKRG